MTGEDIEWLDDGDDAPSHPDEVLAAGSSRPPMRRRTRLVLGGLAVAVVAAGVVVAVATGTGSTQQAAPTTRTVAPSSTVRSPAIVLPQHAPRTALRAIRAAFPAADLTGFSAAIGASDEGPYLSYNLRTGHRLITVAVGPPRLGDTDAVLRTATSVEIAQLLGAQRVRVSVRTESGAPTATDFAAVQRLVQDTRLLASK